MWKYNEKSRYYYLLQVYVQFYICQGNEEWIYLFYLFIFWDMKDSCFISKRPPLRFHPVKPFDGPRGIFDKDPLWQSTSFPYCRKICIVDIYYTLGWGTILTIEKQDIGLLKFDHTRVQLGYCWTFHIISIEKFSTLVWSIIDELDKLS